jgi:hypothetical protein
MQTNPFEEIADRLTRIENCLLRIEPEINPPGKKEVEYIYTISGLAEFLQCSIPTAQKLKNSGRIPVKQFGRKLVFIKSEVLQALSGTPYPRKTA